MRRTKVEEGVRHIASPQVLRGGRGVIRRDAPVLTTEVHRNSNEALDLLQTLSALGGYEVFEVVGEVCGLRRDCRNLLNLPTLRRPMLRWHKAVRSAIDTGVLRQVVGTQWARPEKTTLVS